MVTSLRKLEFMVVEARIDARMSILDIRTSCFDTNVVTVKRCWLRELSDFFEHGIMNFNRRLVAD